MANGLPSARVICVDFDGTIAPSVWPGRPTELMPGCADALRRFARAGYAVLVFSARLAPVDPGGQGRDAKSVEDERAWMRDFLNTQGLAFTEIHDDPWKPGAAAYIDDKAERYNGAERSWERLADKVLVRLGKEDGTDRT